MGTGCDTILAQMAADCLDTDMKISWYSVWIQIFLPMIPVLMHLPQPTLPEMRDPGLRRTQKENPALAHRCLGVIS